MQKSSPVKQVPSDVDHLPRNGPRAKARALGRWGFGRRARCRGWAGGGNSGAGARLLSRLRCVPCKPDIDAIGELLSGLVFCVRCGIASRHIPSWPATSFTGEVRGCTPLRWDTVVGGSPPPLDNDPGTLCLGQTVVHAENVVLHVFLARSGLCKDVPVWIHPPQVLGLSFVDAL